MKTLTKHRKQLLHELIDECWDGCELIDECKLHPSIPHKKCGREMIINNRMFDHILDIYVVYKAIQNKHFWLSFHRHLENIYYINDAHPHNYYNRAMFSIWLLDQERCINAADWFEMMVKLQNGKPCEECCWYSKNLCINVHTVFTSIKSERNDLGVCGVQGRFWEKRESECCLTTQEKK